ncbi:tyrosinase family protein [Mesorhizobium sp.]|uniref:tyrosinase family protein n=1 Tax=Mesorhizobium sp. TaxID=1871066 RepID=UPI000FE95C20|nr:tyrosinase family protein [Mesorhizobium sp.]RWD94250.1 MAG: tyrosinase family protein [Mesorhizobium sp.]
MVTRRAFVQGGIALALASASRVSPAAGQNVVIRRSVTQFDPADPDLEAYRVAVAAMQGLPDSDPRNWSRMARIHLDHCPHTNWYFLPWHRAYLYSFEQICRELSGKKDFALPYWDWFIDRQLPVPFRPNGSTNVLDHARPGFSGNASLPESTFAQSVLTRILGAATFEEFGSQRPSGQTSSGPEWLRQSGTMTELEFGPHNSVHSILRGDMVTFMSPLDPIFWLHHCNIDRIWTLWSRAHPAAVLDPLFLEMKFDGQFPLPAGAPFNPQVKELLNTEALDYRYEPLANFVAMALDPKLIERISVWQGLTQVGLGDVGKQFQPIKVPTPSTGDREILVAAANVERKVDITAPLSVPLVAPAPIDTLLGNLGFIQSGMPAPELGANNVRVLAKISSIVPPHDQSTAVRVFINCNYLSPETPVTDPHFVTTISFFEDTEHGGHAGMGNTRSVSIDLTSTLATVRRNGDLGTDKLLIQLMPVGKAADPAGTAVSVGSMSAVIL